MGSSVSLTSSKEGGGLGMLISGDGCRVSAKDNAAYNPPMIAKMA